MRKNNTVFQVRINEIDKETLMTAAKIEGKSTAEFIIEPALKKAKKLIAKASK